MLHPAHQDLLLEALSLPTAPFAEGAVLAYVERFCGSRRGLRLKRDQAGNLLVHLRRGRRVGRPVCLTAHLDHPGFVADRMLGAKRLRAHWRGGVRPEYFKNSRVRFFADGRWTRATVRSVRLSGEGAARRVADAVVDVHEPVPCGAPGMWDLPDGRIRGRRIVSRACDDLAGVAAMLCAIEEIHRRRVDAEAYFLFTRAEEVGFVGALAACRLKTIPRGCVVVAVETSPELPSARIGDGPIMRIGDKASVFHPAASAWCNGIAADLAKRDKSFTYQRKLMDGGTCESTAYCQFGYEATGVCLALGNYHNMDTKRRRLAAEYVDLADFASLVKWFVELARAHTPYTGGQPELVTRLRKIDRQYRKLVNQTRSTPVY